MNLPTAYTIEVSMWGWINSETRKTVDLDLGNLLSFGKGLALSINDWFTIMDQVKVERVKRAVQIYSQKKGKVKKSLQDILGNEDYIEFKDEIEIELRHYQ